MITKTDIGKWLVDIRADGRGSNRVRKTFDTQREAKEFEFWFKSQQTASVWEKQKDNRTLGDAIKTWWEQVGAMQKSGADKHARLKRICVTLGNPKLKNINNSMLYEFRAARVADVSSETANKEIVYINSVLRHIGVTPAIIKKLKVRQEEMHFLSNSEIKDLLFEIRTRSEAAYVLCRACIETGSRWGEGSAIALSQVKDGYLVLPSKHTKNNKPRYIPISKKLAELIKTNIPFPDCRSTFHRSIDACNINLPVGQATHVMRHTFASHFMMNGGNIITLQRVLDHGDLKTTMRYAHLSANHLEDVLKFKPVTE